jgi:hypothetical protein
MKRLLAVMALATLGWLGLSSARAAPLPPCLDMNEQLRLLPTTASYNGQAATPGAGALYVTDAGVEFYVVQVGELTAVRAEDSTACPRPVEEVIITVVDPWTGERFSLSAKGTP